MILIGSSKECSAKSIACIKDGAFTRIYVEPSGRTSYLTLYRSDDFISDNHFI